MSKKYNKQASRERFARAYVRQFKVAVVHVSEALQLLILNAHSLGPEGSANLLAVPRHEIEITENVARALRRAGAAEAARLDRCEA